MNILLVSPEIPDTFWGFKHALPFISKKAAYPPLGLMTVAAMLPSDWKMKLVDLNVSRLSDTDIAWADYVLVSAMIVHIDSVRSIVARCDAQGKVVIAGGPLFTTMHDRFPEIHHFVLGEAEDLIGDLIRDMSAGTIQHYYESPAKPDVTKTPVPRWDLIRMRDYASMPLQYSRGCPFNCDFCDIIVMYGRIPRVKTPAQMIVELESLVKAGWKGEVFIVDDNFIGHKAEVRMLLRELAAWRKRQPRPVNFITEASINLVDIPGLLDLMVEAGFTKVFIGIETPNPESLVECAKVQNTRRDLVACVRKIQNAGIEVMGGFIVGFDNDDSSIFSRQWGFIQEAGVVTAMVGLLTALPETRLFKRLAEEGRILHHSTGNNLDAVLNFIPKLDREVLVDGYRSLVKNLYAPGTYYRRALTFLQQYRPRQAPKRVTFEDVMAFARSIWVMGVRTRGRREFWKYVTKSLVFHRRAFTEAITLAVTGYHFRRVAATL